MKHLFFVIALWSAQGCGTGTSEPATNPPPGTDTAVTSDAAADVGPLSSDGEGLAELGDIETTWDGSVDTALPWDVPESDAVAAAEDASNPVVPDAVLADAGDQPLPEGLHGEVPQDAIPVPEFVATNHDGATRGPGDLIGQPTVLWFFPFAGTPG